MFTFKRFHIDDGRCAMKVGTDGVLLGAWFDVGAGAEGGNSAQAIRSVGETVGERLRSTGRRPGRNDAKPSAVEFAWMAEARRSKASEAKAKERFPNRPEPDSHFPQPGETEDETGTDERAAGTDGGSLRILDVGTGCGLIALMAAQRSESERRQRNSLNLSTHPMLVRGSGRRKCTPIYINAIDIDGDCIADAEVNIGHSPWAERITLQHIAFDEFVRRSAPASYDRIVSNPPYFTDSLLPPDSGRAGARHAISLTPRDLADGAARLLKPDGLLAVILPPDEAEAFIDECASARLYPRRRTTVHAFAHTPPKRVLLELGFGQDTTKSAAREERLVIHDTTPGTTAASFTAEYRVLTRDFYLNF